MFNFMYFPEFRSNPETLEFYRNGVRFTYSQSG